MRSGARLKQLGAALLPALALACALPVAAASAHGHFSRGWHHGYWGDNAVVAGTITTVGTNSFGASAYVVTPGPGNSTAPTPADATILTGPDTKVIAQGQTGLTAGDDFYAVYRGVSSSTPLATLETDTPTVVYAYAAPTPEVEVKGVVTTAPASGSDSFVATAYVVAPPHFHPLHGQGFGGWGESYSYGGGIGGGYGFSAAAGYGHANASFGRAAHVRSHARSHCLPGSTPVSQGTPNTTITTDANTKITIDGQTAPVSSLTVGDRFTATYDGTPSEPLATITATPALSISAWAPPVQNSFYGFVGTVTGADTTAGTVSVNVTNSIPSALFSGADTFTVGSQTMVLGNSSGSLAGVSTGDVVAGGLFAPSGESAGTVESTPLQVLVDFSSMAPSPLSSSSVTGASISKSEHRALRMLRHEKAKLRHHERKQHRS